MNKGDAVTLPIVTVLSDDNIVPSGKASTPAMPITMTLANLASFLFLKINGHEAVRLRDGWNLECLEFPRSRDLDISCSITNFAHLLISRQIETFKRLPKYKSVQVNIDVDLVLMSMRSRFL